jgi:hypothetical protein
MSRLADYYHDFNYYFDDMHGDIIIAGISFSPSDILKEMDPIAYNEEFNNYCDMMGVNTDEVEYV